MGQIALDSNPPDKQPQQVIFIVVSYFSDISWVVLVEEPKVGISSPKLYTC
jgi:hypothetical protein